MPHASALRVNRITHMIKGSGSFSIASRRQRVRQSRRHGCIRRLGSRETISERRRARRRINIATVSFRKTTVVTPGIRLPHTGVYRPRRCSPILPIARLWATLTREAVSVLLVGGTCRLHAQSLLVAPRTPRYLLHLPRGSLARNAVVHQASPAPLRAFPASRPATSATSTPTRRTSSSVTAPAPAATATASPPATAAA